MQFTFTAILSVLASLAAAETIHFINQDSTTRTIYFTQNAGLPSIAPLTVGGLQTVIQNFPSQWIGNFYSVSEGAVNKPGMLGEIAWRSWEDNTFFDVSAIVDPTDNNGVKMLFPMNDQKTLSGCEIFPCANVYVKADDIQTQSTKELDLICLIGNKQNNRRRGAVAEANANANAQ